MSKIVGLLTNVLKKHPNASSFHFLCLLCQTTVEFVNHPPQTIFEILSKSWLSKRCARGGWACYWCFSCNVIWFLKTFGPQEVDTRREWNILSLTLQQQFPKKREHEITSDIRNSERSCSLTYFLIWTVVEKLKKEPGNIRVPHTV